jgi:hypothetical protein
LQIIDLLLIEVLGLAGFAMIIGHNIWSRGELPIVVTLVGRVMAIRGAGLLALPPDTTIKVFNALHYEDLFYLYMRVTAVLRSLPDPCGFQHMTAPTGPPSAFCTDASTGRTSATGSID